MASHIPSLLDVNSQILFPFPITRGVISMERSSLTHFFYFSGPLNTNWSNTGQL